MQEKSKQQLLKEKEQLTAKQARLKELKEKQKEKFAKELQEELSEVTERLVDLDEELELAADVYTCPPDTADKVHLMLIKGRRFDSSTGKEISEPFLQIFSYGEWELFKVNKSLLGYSIHKILHDPFKEAHLYMD